MRGVSRELRPFKRLPSWQGDHVEENLKFTAKISRDGEWFVASSPEYPEGNGQGVSEEEAVESLRLSIVLLNSDKEIDGNRHPLRGDGSAWKHLSKFAGTVGDDFTIPERTDECRPVPELE